MMSTRDDILERWQRANPLTSHMLGIHKYDGVLVDFTPDTVEGRISEIIADLELIKNYFNGDRVNDFESELIRSTLEAELFYLKHQREFSKSPLSWFYPLSIIEMSYMAREFAPLDDRLRSVITIERQIPAYLESMYDILEKNLALPKLEMGVSFLVGIINYLKDNMISEVTKTDDEKLILDWSDANITAVAALEKCREIMENEYLPRAHQEFALGRNKFLELLKYTEGVDISLEKLLEIGEEDLENNRSKLLGYADKYGGVEKLFEMLYDDLPSPGDLIDDIKESLHRVREFVVDADLLDLPSDEMCEVIQTPGFARSFAFAAMNTPGPFEKAEASQSYYWVTLPEPCWSVEKQRTFMKLFNRPFIEMVTIHEAFPGHYVQLLYNQQSKSEISKMMGQSTSMIEGWGHYTEEMVYEEGYSPFDRDLLHIGQLIAALHRNARYICAIKMHCHGMSVEEAKKFFMEQAFLPEPNALIEANRGAVNPMYLNYTLGKLMIKKLRDDYREEQGGDYSLKNFHNLMLSYASPPISVLRKIVLENDSGDIL